MFTIATNMSGRGTDIVLGGRKDDQSDEDWKKNNEIVLNAGGLHILGTERHESRRIDNQLRGRSGRQGDPGSSRFYLSLEDNLMRIFASDKVSAFMKKMGMDEGESIEHAWVTKAIENAQKKVEGHNFDIRKQLLEFDNIINKLDVGVIKLPEFMHIEGGDVVLHNGKLFIGTYLDANYSSLITARTNIASIEYLKKMLPNIEIIPIEIKKSNTNIFENTLHLDCCFQTIGPDKAIICPDGFKNKEDYEFLIKFFGRKNVFLANSRESFMLTSNCLLYTSPSPRDRG